MPGLADPGRFPARSRVRAMTANGSSLAVLEGRTAPMPGARVALLLLLSINLFNYIDRQVLAATVENIEK